MGGGAGVPRAAGVLPVWHNNHTCGQSGYLPLETLWPVEFLFFVQTARRAYKVFTAGCKFLKVIRRHRCTRSMTPQPAAGTQYRVVARPFFTYATRILHFFRSFSLWAVHGSIVQISSSITYSHADNERGVHNC